MSEHAESPGFSDEEFDAIQAAVMETDRGRQFLSEFSHRVRAADTEVLLDAIRRLEDNMMRLKAGPQEVQDDLADLANAITATSDDICAVRNDMLDDKCAIEPGRDVFSSLSADAGQIARALTSTAEALQASAAGLKQTAADSEQIAAIDANVSTLFESGWRQDVLTQRVSKAMGLLTHLQNSLSIYAAEQAAAVTNAESVETELTEENRSYFAADAELFEDAGNGNDTARAAASIAAASVTASAFAVSEPAVGEETLVFSEIAELQEKETDAQGVADEPISADGDTDATADAMPDEHTGGYEQGAAEAAAEPAITEESAAPVAEAAPEADQQPATTAQGEAHAAAETAQVGIPAVEPRVVIIRGHADTPHEPEALNQEAANQTPVETNAKPEPQATSADEALEPFAPAAPTGQGDAATTPQATEIILEEDTPESIEVTPADHTATASAECEPAPARQTLGMAEPAPSAEPAGNEGAVDPDQNEPASSEYTEPPSEAAEPPAAEEQSASDGTSDVMEAFSDFAEKSPATDFAIEEAPQPELTPTKEEKERIVIIRKDSSSETSIPFAEYLGIDEQANKAPETTDKD